MLRAAAVSLIATGVAVALFGIFQQMLGWAGVINLGYSWGNQVRLYGSHLRSFGTLDDPFVYATFLLTAIAAALFWMRRGPLMLACLSVMVIGVAVAYVRTAILIAVALGAVWLIQNRRVTLGFVLLAASVTAGVAFLVSLPGASETQSVRAAPSTYVTLNGRTTVWATIFSRPTKVPFGLGVAKVGTAAQRAQSGVIIKGNATKKVITVDSGYFATVADVGVVGLVILLALVCRILAIGAGAARRGDVAGWLVIGWMVVLLLDALTRSAFTGFPTAFLSMLLVGIGLACSMSRAGSAAGRLALSMAVRASLVALNASGVSGVPRYTASLAREIDAIAPAFPGLELTLLTTRHFADTLSASHLAVRAIGPARRGLSGPLRLAAEQLAPIVAQSDVLHYFDVNAPLLDPRRRFVTTFHDASLVRTVATNFPLLRRGYKRRLYPWSLPRASAIVAVSEFAKEKRFATLASIRNGSSSSTPGQVSAARRPRLERTAQTGAGGCSSARICSSWAT